jgi:hypothetical protein
MAGREKILWVVNYDRLEDFRRRALDVGATGVAIRTDNNVERAIPAFHDHGVKVYGWRWPSAKRDPALREADKAANLLALGLDGYFVDPEGARGKPYDWNLRGLDELADDFCRTIAAAAPASFGMTSHYRGKRVFSRLPWDVFFRHATLLLPQSYWRSDDGTIGDGIPEDNYQVGLTQWSDLGGDPAKIVPMAGELAHSTGDEIDRYVRAAATHDIDALHFYAYDDDVDDDVWDAIRRA